MELEGVKIGFVLTGAFCMFPKIISKIQELKKEKAEIIPIMSYSSYYMDTKFGKANDFVKEIKKITGKEVIHTISEAESIGTKKMTDIMVIAPCTGNTIAKLATDIIDTPAVMAAKSHLKNDAPLIIAPVTSSGLSESAENIGRLLNKKNYYFVPFRQNNPITKPRAIAFDIESLIKTIKFALDGEQISPILI